MRGDAIQRGARATYGRGDKTGFTAGQTRRLRQIYRFDFAYQGIARGLGADKVDALNRMACGEVMPDLTIFLDLSPSLAFARKGGADSDDRLEQEGFDFHNKVYDGYLQAAKLYPDRIVKIDCSGDALSTHKK